VPHLYVYYRIQAEDSDAAREAVTALQARLSSFCGTPPRHMVRCEDGATWMEVYEDVRQPQALVDAMQDCLNEPGLDILRRSERHLECFCET
jgi:hypothetical protein